LKNLTTNDRIKHLISFKQLSISSFSREIGLINGVTISKIINQNRKPSSKTIGRIIQAFPDINYDWLVNGEGEMIKGSVVKSIKTNEDDLTVTTKQVIDFMKEYYPNSTQESEDRLDKKIDIGKKELIDFMYLGKSDLIDFMNAGKTDLKEIIDDSFLKVLKKSEEIQHKSEDSRVKFDLAHAKTLKKVETLEKEIKVLNGKLSHIDYLVENIEKYNLIEEHRKEEIFNQNKK
jgi:hypothetical protein|tara:strand:+ start:288 stop:986 length:699 start_codon:yes stop_codon:yes gene_type:complete